MEGFDSDWITVNADRRIAIYTNLNPGTYTLRIKSTNGEGIWQQNDKILLINVLRPFWQMWWFYLAAAVFLLFLLYLFFKIRLLRITRQKSELENMVKLRTREVERQKEEIVAQKIEIENKQLEIIDQAIKLHEQDQSKITFFTNISHEFRTPLTLIEGPLSEVIRNNKNPESDTFLKLIEKNVKRLLRLVNQLLDIEKIEAKNLAPTYIHSDLNEFLRSTAQLFQPLAVSTKINYEINVDPSIQFAEFDPDILDKILYNVLSNAFKYTPPYGHIVFSVNIDEKNKLHLEVSDTGVGMTPNNLKNIFERFYQGENAVYKTGTGIGLYLVKQLVELLNGTITAESEKDKGTKIRIVLPYNKSSESSVVLVDDFKETEIISTDLSEADIQVRTHILIIDDNEDMRNYLGKVLGKNYSVFYAENATQALEEVEKSLPELILSDVMMPGMDGIELCRKLKSDIRTSHLPLILLTAKAFDEDKNEGFLAGADDYIIKPFNSQLLKVRIANLINSRKRIKERYGKEVSLEFKEITVSQLDEKLLERLTVLIGANLQNENLDVEFLCKEIGISRTLLYNKLKTLTGLTIGDFILNIRLKKAINLMLTIGSLSITEISELVGFNDPEYFRKIFKKNMGCSPTEYLKKHSS